MGMHFDEMVDKFLRASAGFERVLRLVRPEQWDWPTPCTEWSVRDLVNHVTRGNLNYVGLLRGASAADFLRLRDVDALRSDPLGAFSQSVDTCAEAFAEPGALRAVLDYPLGRAAGGQLLAVRTTDTVVHTWDLARGTRNDEALDATLVAWINENLALIYAGLAEAPTDPGPTHRFFASATHAPGENVGEQDLLLHRMGRSPMH
jgi:uncharacterized protein (TIGR03086 family)